LPILSDDEAVGRIAKEPNTHDVSQLDGSTGNDSVTTSTIKANADLTELKLVFRESSDNQGRITVYQVEILG
jgi:hypothetical protein